MRPIPSETNKVLSTGSPQLDNELLVDFDGRPVGGFPCGSVCVIQGGPSVGKTTLALATLSTIERTDEEAEDTFAWMDLDAAFSGEIGRTVFRTWGVRKGGMVLQAPPDNTFDWAVTTIEQIGPLVDLLVLDRIENAAESTSEMGVILKALWDVAVESDTCVLCCAGEWFSPSNNVEFTFGDKQFATYATLGIKLPNPGIAETFFSKISQYPKRVRFGYNTRIHQLLPKVPSDLL